MSETEWKPIETAPKDGRAVILCWAINADGDLIRWNESPNTAGVFVQVASWRQPDNGEEGWWNVYIDTPSDADLHFDPTHWMPLPQPPESN